MTVMYKLFTFLEEVPDTTLTSHFNGVFNGDYNHKIIIIINKLIMDYYNNKNYDKINNTVILPFMYSGNLL